MTTLTIAIIAVYIAALFVIAYVGNRVNRRRGNTPEEYFLGGRSLGPFVLVLTLAASWFSMGGFIGTPGFSFMHGTANLVYPIWQLIIAVSIWVVGQRAWLLSVRFGLLTPTQMYQKYYGSQLLTIVVLLTFLTAILPQALVQLTGAGKTLDAISGGVITYGVGVAIFLIAVMVYAYFGGLRAVAWTDVLQGIFFGAIMIFMLVSIIAVSGGIGPAFESVQQNAPEKLAIQWESVPPNLSHMIQTSIGFLGMPYIFQRFFMARSPRTIGITAGATALLNTWVFAATVMIFGVLGTGIYSISDLGGDPDRLVGTFFADYFPIMGAFIVAAAFAAGMSSMDSILLTASSLFSVDLYKGYFSPGASEQSVRRSGQLFVIGTVVLLLILAFTGWGQGVIATVNAVGFGLALQVVPVMLGPLFFPRITAAGALAGLVCGYVASFLFHFPFGQPFGFWGGVWGLLINLIVMVVVSAFTKPVEYSTQARFHGLFKSELQRATMRTKPAM